MTLQFWLLLASEAKNFCWFPCILANNIYEQWIILQYKQWMLHWDSRLDLQPIATFAVSHVSLLVAFLCENVFFAIDQFFLLCVYSECYQLLYFRFHVLLYCSGIVCFLKCITVDITHLCFCHIVYLTVVDLESILYVKIH